MAIVISGCWSKRYVKPNEAKLKILEHIMRRSAKILTGPDMMLA